MTMRVIGILGGVASGKSLVAQQMEQLGAAVIQADQLGHEVLAESDVRAALQQRWGDHILDAQGFIDRKAVAERVFGEGCEQELRFLEEVTHPRISRQMRQRLEELEAAGRPVAVLDAALLLKAGWHTFCDFIVFVDVPLAERLQRARARGWQDGELLAREAAQESVDEKRAHADWVIDNSGSPEHTFTQVNAIWRSVGELSQCSSPRQGR